MLFTNVPILHLDTYLHLPVPQEIDEYDLVDPVDILTPLEKSGFWEGVVSVLSL